MNKKTSKIFSIFWVISGLAWIIVTVRYMLRNDLAGAILYLVAAITSFILAFAYYKNLVK